MINGITSCGHNLYFRHTETGNQNGLEFNEKSEAVHFYELPTKVAQLFLIIQMTLSEIILCRKTFRHLSAETIASHLCQ